MITLFCKLSILSLFLSYLCSILQLHLEQVSNYSKLPYNQVGYNEITAYNEMEILPQSTKCINYYPLITNIRI